MKKKALALAIASSLVAPQALAAQDTSGMHYTSASEGFYASIRVSYSTSGGGEEQFVGNDDAGSDFDDSFSRIGIRGDNDLGGGLTGFYQYELGADDQQGGAPGTRLLNVGLRGGFGEVVAGSFWNNAYNWTYGTTDIANHFSGYFLSSGGGTFFPLNGQYALSNRINNSLQYTTPDLNGFQGSIIVTAKDRRTPAVAARAAQGCVNSAAVVAAVDAVTAGDADVRHGGRAAVAANTVVCGDISGATNNSVTVAPRLLAADGTTEIEAAVSRTGANITALPVAAVAAKDDENDIDVWRVAVKYDVAGFSTGASYVSAPDSLANGSEDHTAYFLKLGYSQDNWYVNGWYGEDNAEDAGGGLENQEWFSLGGGVSVDKVSIYALYEQLENVAGAKGVEDAYATLGVQYSLGAQSRVFVEYSGQDKDSDAAADDVVIVGLRHDF